MDFVNERTCDSNPCPSSEDDQELTYSYSYEDTLGIDLDAFQMSLETEDNEDLPYDYLLECRKKFIRKIEWYRKQLDTSTSENTYLVSTGLKYDTLKLFIRILHSVDQPQSS